MGVAYFVKGTFLGLFSVSVIWNITVFSLPDGRTWRNLLYMSPGLSNKPLSKPLFANRRKMVGNRSVIHEAISTLTGPEHADSFPYDLARLLVIKMSYAIIKGMVCFFFITA